MVTLFVFYGKIKEKAMDSFMMTRSAFCSCCYEAGRPQENDLFVLYQGTKQQIVVMKTDSRTIWGEKITKGMTPHLFSLVRAIDGKVHYMKNCLMNCCGVTIKQDVNEQTGEMFVDFDFENTQHGTMSVADWNALVSRWHGYTGFEI